jgi:hypothetical protein
MGTKYVFNPTTGNLDATDVVAFNGEVDLGTAAAPSIFFTGDPNTGIYSPSADQVAISTNGTGRLFVDASGNVGVGVSTPQGTLSVEAEGRVVTIGDSGVANRPLIKSRKSDDSDYAYLHYDAFEHRFYDSGVLSYVNGQNQHMFSTNSSERLRIDSSGRLLVGTSSASALANTVLQGHSGSSTQDGRLYIQRGATSLGTNTRTGQINFADSASNVGASIESWTDDAWASGDYPGRLVFSTCPSGSASPVERVRIVNDGRTDVFATAETLRVRTAATTAAASIAIRLQAAATTLGTGGTTEFQVTSNGNVANTNNAYGAISDIKLKENIVDASSQWDDLKALQVRNYNFKEGQTHTQIGLIAQEVEQVSPGLVSESPDLDEEGNDLGTVTKSVNYSVLYMKAVKALQEAMERIEVLEAKVNALEGN